MITEILYTGHFSNQNFKTIATIGPENVHSTVLGDRGWVNDCYHINSLEFVNIIHEIIDVNSHFFKLLQLTW